MTQRQRARILEISSYPPPRAGWGVRISFIREHLEASGHHCQVLNIGQSRKLRSADYLDVQNGLDYIRKVVRHALRGYLIHTHLNGDSPKGLALALIAELVSLLAGRRAVLTFHAGPEQRFFPKRRSWLMAPLYSTAFTIPALIICNNLAVKRNIAGYGIQPKKIVVIPAFSRQYLTYTPVALPHECERLLSRYRRVAASYFFHRPEFFVDSMMEALREVSRTDRDLGLVLIGADTKSAAITRMIEEMGLKERTYLAGDLPHDEFMSVLARVHAFVRTPKKDGVCSSVLEALSLRVPVVASENGSRPHGVVTFRPNDARDMTEKLRYVLANYDAVRARIPRPNVSDTVRQEAELLVSLSVGADVMRASALDETG